ELYSGFLKGDRPSFGSIVSKLRSDAGLRRPIPPYVYIGDANHVGRPGFLGKAHEAYIHGEKGANLGLSRDMTQTRLAERRSLLHSFDTVRRDLDDAHGSMAGLDAFQSQALEMITTNKARDAFDIGQEPQR